ncbi:hypothetical protein ACNOYE_18335 [Nannocystaceae bacterium ST9]
MTDWWGEFEFDAGVCRRWRIGPLTLWVTRLAKEWQVAFERTRELDATVDVDEGEPPPGKLERSRYLFEQGSKLGLIARVADRPVVARPEMPVIVPGGLSATLFVSTPVWVALSAGEPRQRFLELPTWLPSSTWFGENNIEGALCYAERTRARHERGSEVFRARVTTSVTVNNVEREPLRIDRIALPLPSMSVFRDEQGGLWTEHAVVDYLANQDAPVKVMRGPLEAIGKTSLVSSAREGRDTNVVVRALSAALREVMP